jgi:hypothetical protein
MPTALIVPLIGAVTNLIIEFMKMQGKTEISIEDLEIMSPEDILAGMGITVPK